MTNIAILINTPAQLHFYEQVRSKLIEKGHCVHTLVRDYGETLELLESSDIDYYIYSKPNKGKLGTLIDSPASILKAINYLKSKDINIVTGFGIYNSIVSLIMGKFDVVFLDSEPYISKMQKIQYDIFRKITNHIIVPIGYGGPEEKNMIHLNSIKESAYLGNNKFVPDSKIMEKYQLSEEGYVILRFNAFDALHDCEVSGFSSSEKQMLVSEILKKYDVLVSVENNNHLDLPEGAKVIQNKKDIHNLIYFAKCVITDTQTLATESALLGTPVIRCNDFVRGRDMGIFKFIESKYGIIFNRKTAEEVNASFEEICLSKRNWKAVRTKMLEDLEDITESFSEALLRLYDASLETSK